MGLSESVTFHLLHRMLSSFEKHRYKDIVIFVTLEWVENALSPYHAPWWLQYFIAAYVE